MKYLMIGFCLMLAVIQGCASGNLSPRHEQRINNQDGKIGEIETLQNSIKAEVGTLKSQSEIRDSQIDRMQQGLANLQYTNENNGVQILSGSGGLVVAMVGLLCMTMLALHYRSLFLKHEKTANILAQSIVRKNDEDLEDAVFQAAMFTDAEGIVLNVIKKQKGFLTER